MSDRTYIRVDGVIYTEAKGIVMDELKKASLYAIFSPKNNLEGVTVPDRFLLNFETDIHACDEDGWVERAKTAMEKISGFVVPGDEFISSIQVRYSNELEPYAANDLEFVIRPDGVTES